MAHAPGVDVSLDGGAEGADARLLRCGIRGREGGGGVVVGCVKGAEGREVGEGALEAARGLEVRVVVVYGRVVSWVRRREGDEAGDVEGWGRGWERWGAG